MSSTEPNFGDFTPTALIQDCREPSRVGGLGGDRSFACTKTSSWPYGAHQRVAGSRSEFGDRLSAIEQHSGGHLPPPQADNGGTGGAGSGRAGRQAGRHGRAGGST
jgi:hypothetical protein